MPKVTAKQAFRTKFSPYRNFFAVSAAFFVLALVLETVLYGSGDFAALPDRGGGMALFSLLFPLEALCPLLLFLGGVTVYGPAFALISAAARGALTGFCLSLLFPLHDGKGVVFFLFLLLYLAVSAWLLLSYGSFCASVALRIYSRPAQGRALFGGTLFYSSLSCGRVNLRFLFSYLLFFLAALALCALLAALYAALLLLL